MSETNIRLMAAAKEFNIGKDTLVDFLAAKGFNKDDLKPTSKLTEEMYRSLQQEFQGDKVAKLKSDQRLQALRPCIPARPLARIAAASAIAATAAPPTRSPGMRADPTHELAESYSPRPASPATLMLHVCWQAPSRRTWRCPARRKTATELF